jgi:hypothetical protein
MIYTPRSLQDSKILIELSDLSLSERWTRLQDLAFKLRRAEASLEKRLNAKSERTKKQEREILADEDGVIELKYRFKLEETEYLNLKAITPDYEEPGSKG